MARKSGKQVPGSPQNRAKKKEAEAGEARSRKRKRVIVILSAAVLILLVAGGATAMYQQRAASVRDLSEVGGGVPAVVQIHDHTCPVCTELKGTVERVQGDFSDESLLIRMADVHTDEGLEFAGRYTAARRATLLFIDGEGNLVTELSGAQSEATLRRLIREHAAGDP